MEMNWKAETFTKFAYPTEVTVSPDGQFIAYSVRRVKLEDNEYETQTVLQNLSNGERYFIDGAKSPAFSPDCSWLLYLKNSEDKGSKVNLMDVETNSHRTLTELEDVIQVDWNEDSEKIFVLTTEGREDEDLYFESDFPVWFDEQGFLDSARYVFSVYDVASGSRLYQVEGERVHSARWYKDKIAFAEMKDRVQLKDFDVKLADGTSTETLFEDVSFYPTFSRDDKLVLTGKRKKDTHFEHNYHYLWDGEEVTELTPDEEYNCFGGINTDIWYSSASPSPPYLDEEGNLYFKTDREGVQYLQKTKVDGKEDVLINDLVVTDYDVSENGTVAYIGVDDGSFAEVYVQGSEDECQRITGLNKTLQDNITTRKMNHIEYENAGCTIDGWYVLPEETGDPMPLVVFVHGGPKGSYGSVVYFLSQVLAENGICVLHTNPRGSNGYSEEFATRVAYDTGGGDFEDIIAGIDELEKVEEIDKGAIGITGISYGGFMTNWAIGQSDRFSAAVSENGISNWLASYANSDIGSWFDRDLIGENPLEDENYRQKSPLFYADEVETPVLFIHSLDDFRCPLPQSVMFYQTLKDLDKEAYISIFKKGSHVHSLLGKPRHRLKRYRLIVDFFVQKLVEKKEKFDPEESLSPDEE